MKKLSKIKKRISKVNRKPRYRRTRRKRGGAAAAEEENQCGICLEKLGNSDKTLDCEHTFHKDCIDRWTNIAQTCPMCRNPTSGPMSVQNRPPPGYRLIRLAGTDWVMGNATISLTEDGTYEPIERQQWLLQQRNFQGFYRRLRRHGYNSEDAMRLATEQQERDMHEAQQGAQWVLETELETELG